MKLSSVLSLALLSAYVSVACSPESEGTPYRGSDRGGAGRNSQTGGSSNAGTSSLPGSGGTSSPGGASGGSGGTGLSGTGASGGGEVIGTPSSAAFELESVATWRGDAKAAYTIIHDDLCTADGLFDKAKAELKKRGLTVGFGAIIKWCNERWDDVKGLSTDGHEVFSHSFSHARLTDGRANLATEIDQAKSELEKQLSTASRTAHDEFFIFPFDAYNATTIERLKAQGYAGARAGSRGLNPSNFADSFKLNFDVYGAPYSIYVGKGPCSGVKSGADTPPEEISAECRSYVMNQFVDDAIDQGGWAIRELHGVDQSWQPIPLADYQAHLDHCVTKVEANELWMSGPTAVLKYRFARELCPEPTISAGNVLKFSEPSADCQKYATAVSYVVTTGAESEPSRLQVEQAGNVFPARKLGPGRFAVDADPTLGDATLTE